MALYFQPLPCAVPWVLLNLPVSSLPGSQHLRHTRWEVRHCTCSAAKGARSRSTACLPADTGLKTMGSAAQSQDLPDLHSSAGPQNPISKRPPSHLQGPHARLLLSTRLLSQVRSTSPARWTSNLQEAAVEQGSMESTPQHGQDSDFHAMCCRRSVGDAASKPGIFSQTKCASTLLGCVLTKQNLWDLKQATHLKVAKVLLPKLHLLLLACHLPSLCKRRHHFRPSRPWPDVQCSSNGSPCSKMSSAVFLPLYTTTHNQRTRTAVSLGVESQAWGSATAPGQPECEAICKAAVQQLSATEPPRCCSTAWAGMHTARLGSMLQACSSLNELNSTGFRQVTSTGMPATGSPPASTHVRFSRRVRARASCTGLTTTSRPLRPKFAMCCPELAETVPPERHGGTDAGGPLLCSDCHAFCEIMHLALHLGLSEVSTSHKGETAIKEPCHLPELQAAVVLVTRTPNASACTGGYSPI